MTAANFACPYCGAEPQTQCQTKRGKKVSYHHMERRLLAARKIRGFSFAKLLANLDQY